MSKTETTDPEIGKSQRQLEQSTAWRVWTFFSVVIAITGTGSYLMADTLWTAGWTFASGVLWLLFTILFGYLAFGFCHAFFGFLVLRFHLPAPETPSGKGVLSRNDNPEEITPRVAVIIPVYNEPVNRVFAGVKTIFESTMREEQRDAFDFFILSDSTKPEQWIAEEAAWTKLWREEKAQNRIFYRRRPHNHAKKSGNVSDFCRTWGENYRYMIVLDADSIMTGKTLVELLARMEANPQVGLIQTAPGLVGGVSAFGRMQQFANRLYGRLFMEGLAFWQECGGNFWGHNAIIRLRPFIEHCELPELPGRKPFGGHILSHDFVEAGLLRRAGWEVWLAHDLSGSFEEGPQGIIESAQRDQRWCQGNLQHSLLLAARGLRGKTRVHLANGILGYVASPLWLLFMSCAYWKVSAFGSEALVDAAKSPGAISLLGITLGLLFGPKLLCLIDLYFDPERTRGFGGRLNATTSAIVETVFSALLAPINMLFHTRFVFLNFLGKTVGWSAQNRNAVGTSWDEAISTHGLQTLAAILVGAVTAMTNPVLFWWLFPVLLGLWLSIPISVWTSRPDLGSHLRQEHVFLTPEEKNPPREVREALAPGQLIDPRFNGLTSAIIDPFLNALHVSLLRRSRRRLLTGRARDVYGEHAIENLPGDESGERIRSLAERCLRLGPNSLDSSETISLLSDIDNMLWMHREAWLRPSRDLAPAWQRAIRETASAV